MPGGEVIGLAPPSCHSMSAFLAPPENFHSAVPALSDRPVNAQVSSTVPIWRWASAWWEPFHPAPACWWQAVQSEDLPNTGSAPAPLPRTASLRPHDNTPAANRSISHRLDARMPGRWKKTPRVARKSVTKNP